MLTTSPVVVSSIARTCWRACKSHPIILISASFGPSTVRVNTEQFTRAVARPASLWHQPDHGFHMSGNPANQALGRISLNNPSQSKTDSQNHRSLYLRVLGSGLLQDGDVGVGAFPQ